MICPKCGREYRPGFRRCTGCDVALVHADDLEDDGSQLVKIFESPDPGLVAFVRSLFAESSIPFVVRNAQSPSLFPGSGVVEIWVNSGDAGKGRALLAEATGEADRGGMRRFARWSRSRRPSGRR